LEEAAEEQGEGLVFTVCVEGRPEPERYRVVEYDVWTVRWPVYEDDEEAEDD
jgi:hypothetical protein